MQKVLVIDDNFQFARVIHSSLGAKRCRTQSAFSLAQAYDFLSRHKYDLLIIDRVLPDGDGLELVHFLHNTQMELPILVVSEKSQVDERVRGLIAGADDYLSKPFSLQELTLRVEKLLNKVKSNHNEVLGFGQVLLYMESGMVRVAKRKIRIRRREFEILVYLTKHKNMVVTREMMVENIWHDFELPTFTTVDVYIRRIRILLGKQRGHLRTIRGYGYMVKD